MKNKAYISLFDVKQALRDSKFRDSLPETLLPEVQRFLNNPSCTCNYSIYVKILKDAKDQLIQFYPEKQYLSPDEEKERLAKNNFTVINCSIGELEARLKLLKPGRKQIAVARFEDQATVIVNELDQIF
jgi:hypothetical protein